jgi:hypothetical protein
LGPISGGELPRIHREHLGQQRRWHRERLVVVQAVAGSSPVAHPHKVAAQGVFLHERNNNSARAELPTSYQFFGGAKGSSWPVSLDLPV